MEILKNNDIAKAVIFVLSVSCLASCNKELPQATPIIYPPANNSTTTIGAAISADTSLSFFKTAAEAAGVMPLLNDTNSLLTVFVPDNDAFRLSGIPDASVISSLPASVLVPLVQYHIIPGEQFTAANFLPPSPNPNVQLPSDLTVGTLPGTPVNFNLTTFPSSTSGGAWDNNIPITQTDLKYSNGIIHKVAALVQPPSQTLKQAIYSNPDLTYFKAAIARGDSGQTGLNRIDSLLGYAVTNMTVLAPDNAAFQTILFGSIYAGLVAEGVDPSTASAEAQALSSSPDVFSNPLLFGILTAADVQGIVVYHLLATNQGQGFQPNIRVFSVNFPTPPTFYTTLVNSVYPTHPGVLAQATFAGPFVAKLQFTGFGSFPPSGTPYSGPAANVVSMDNHCVNGVYDVIDQVLLPQ
ncbi:MAG TPA: fasciclin domain-containing protein [Chitinophagaceae bacterium]|nr:fasciclin domain-containing protein [Chitinophagaceae bacterium]